MLGIHDKTKSALIRPFKGRNIPLNSLDNKLSNTGEYFDILNDKSMIKDKDKEIAEIIDSQQLSNTTFVIEIDDFKELDSFITLLDPTTPKDIKIYNTDTFPNFSSITTRPKLLIKAFKFSFIGDDIKEYAALEKHQMFATNMNEVYSKVIRQIKNVFDQDQESDNRNQKGLKKGRKNELSKSYDNLKATKTAKSIIVSSFKVLFNIDEKSEVHVCIYCMCWDAPKECLSYHNEELDYLKKNKYD